MQSHQSSRGYPDHSSEVWYRMIGLLGLIRDTYFESLDP